MLVVVSVTEKARRGSCQVWVGKTSESEPLLRCRKEGDAVRTGVTFRAPGGVQEVPVYCLGGGRHVGGVIPVWALV
jgi:hypothetical protein